MSATAEGSPRLDLAAARARLAAGDAPAFWRSLDELADAHGLRDFLENEFPRFAEHIASAPDRRSVLKLMGAALAMGGLSACKAAEKIVPYVNQPENVVPGRPLHFATTLALDGYGFGALVESHDGRPTKIEGNPLHPASLGATDAIMQAACLSLYDPGRSRMPLKNGQPSNWDAFLGAVDRLRNDLGAAQGKGFAVLIGTVTSPSVAALLDRLSSDFPEARTYRFDPLAADGERQALGAVFGRPLATLPRLDRAAVILSLDADFLGEGPGRLTHARAFAGRRILRDGAKAMARLYAVESTPTLTGAAADHRWAVRPSEVEGAARALAARLGIGTAGESALPEAALAAIAGDLKQAGGGALVLAGPHQPESVHRLALAMNAALGAVGTTLAFIPPPEYGPPDAGGLADLTTAIDGGTIDALLILDGDPAYAVPGDIPFADALRRVPLSFHWGLYADRTAGLSNWHMPAAHDLEGWGDLRAFDGSASPVQPLIAPLHGGRTAHEVLAAFLGDYTSDAQTLVRGYWRARGLDDNDWRKALQAGIFAGTAPSSEAPAVPAGIVTAPVNSAPAAAGIEVRFVPDPWLRAGANARNVWLQELPRPLSKIVWGNAALIAPATAERLGAANGDVLTLTRGTKRVDVPAWITPGHPAEAVTLILGYGLDGPEGEPVGIDVQPLRDSAAPWMIAGVSVSKAGTTGRIITTQHHQAMEGRDIVRHGGLAGYLENPAFLHGDRPPDSASLYPGWSYPEEAWGMVIDQSACIGCMACVSACQAENNTPSVGAEECDRGHEMHWLRVDRYYTGDPAAPDTFLQPVPCMQCEKAPCEVVCPVNATVHTHDGLNAQVYNRCIGTRYCSQNCPYKVRRFNFLEYQPYAEGKGAPLAPLMNPDVTVRSRGVMEKCTYCVQRINRARIDADVAGAAIADGAITPACAQACPTQAIVFGNLNDTKSEVRRLRDHPLDYTLLAELNTRPRTTYLARVTNPNPLLAEAKDG